MNLQFILETESTTETNNSILFPEILQSARGDIKVEVQYLT